MPDRTKYALTWSQREHLKMLLAAEAFDRDSSKNIFHAALRHLVPGVVGTLCDKGFADRKVRTAAGGSRCMHYWLTEGGAHLARQILQEN